jgi:hypothetical protein
MRHKPREIKFMNTNYIKAILNHPQLLDSKGKDCEDIKEELEQVLWERESREHDKAIEAEIEQRDKELEV